METDTLDDLKLIVDAAKAAGEIGLKYFKKNPDTWTKSGNSPVTEADIAIDTYLRETLIGARPSYGWLSEETEDNPARLATNKAFIVDPIDGTRGFIEGSEHWVVSIALVEKGCPVIGVLYGPVLDKLYVAVDGEGATLNGKRIAASSAESLLDGEFIIPARIATTIQEQLNKQMKRAPHIPSLAYRIALIADGTYSAGIARPGACDWDIAAADLILTEAGGQFTDLNGHRLVYNKAKTRHEWLLSSGKLVQEPLKAALSAAIDIE